MISAFAFAIYAYKKYVTATSTNTHTKHTRYIDHSTFQPLAIFCSSSVSDLVGNTEVRLCRDDAQCKFYLFIQYLFIYTMFIEEYTISYNSQSTCLLVFISVTQDGDTLRTISMR